MEINTFEKWNSLGFDIKKGSKAICFIEEVPYFTKEQVKEKPKKYYINNYDSNYDSVYDKYIKNYEEEMYYDENTIPRAMESEEEFYDRKLQELSSGDGWGPMGVRS